MNNYMFEQLEEKLDLSMLADLQIVFQEADVDNSGSLELDEFKEVVKHAMKVACRVIHFHQSIL